MKKALAQAKPKPSSRFISRADVLDRIGVAYVTIWRWMQQGRFPASREIGGKVAWLESDIDNWIATRPVRQFKKGA